MISKLILCYELCLEDLRVSIAFLNQTLKPREIVCLKPNELLELEDSNFKDSYTYTFHLNLDDEINTHAKISRLFNQLKQIQLNPFYEDKNMFDNKFLFSKFALANSIPHPKTYLLKELSSDFDDSFIVKPCHGTEKIDFANFSQTATEKILAYDDAIVQPKIQIKQEYKVLYLLGNFYSNFSLASNLISEIKIFDSKIETYFELNNLKKPSIYSIDIIEDFDSNIFFLEINLRPGALYRFSYLLSVPVS
jgi:glutathione synthase/RimK-type ligase-like ATP-grasp enzyme